MVECATLELVRVCLIDASMNKYKPSVVAAALVFAGFETQFEVMLEKPSLKEMLKNGTVAEVGCVYKLWRFEICEKKLCLPEIQKVIAFCDFILKRQRSLLAEYRTQF